MEAETYPLRRERYEFMRWFQGTVVSSHERVAKPAPEIFHRLLDRFGLDPTATLLIDDSQANVDAARRVGMQAIRFQSPAQVRAHLEQAGVLSAVLESPMDTDTTTGASDGGTDLHG
jgi:2-haloacid dehalogenase